MSEHPGQHASSSPVPADGSLAGMRMLITQDQWNRSGRKGVGSKQGETPWIIAVISFPVTGARLRPSMLCPVARKAFLSLGTRPMIGRLSQVMGRQPNHVSRV